MSSDSETTPPSQIHHRFTSDLLEIYPAEKKHTFQDRRMFRVLSDVLSDRKINSGDLIAARSFHAMAYDSDRARSVLFGGQVGNTLVNDTWEWDGAEWTQVADTGPSSRDACAATYDTSRHRMILFGGETSSGGVLGSNGETWEFGGGVWTQVATTGRGPTIGAALAYSGTAAILYNPNNGTTWTWDGKHWTERQDIGPGSRVGVDLAYDSQRKRAVLFGGVQGDTWELFEVA